jgi:hypothetical protein
MDDQEFASQLELLDLSPPDPNLAASLERWDRLEDGLVTDQTADVEVEEWTPRRGAFDDPPDAVETTDDPPSTRMRIGRAALIAGGFLLMMVVGAGAAALVFHDRVAQLLR